MLLSSCLNPGVRAGWCWLHPWLRWRSGLVGLWRWFRCGSALPCACAHTRSAASRMGTQAGDPDAALVEKLRTALDASNSPQAALNFTVTVAASPSAGSGAVADAAAAVSGNGVARGRGGRGRLGQVRRAVGVQRPVGSASAGGGDRSSSA